MTDRSLWGIIIIQRSEAMQNIVQDRIVRKF